MFGYDHNAQGRTRWQSTRARSGLRSQLESWPPRVPAARRSAPQLSICNASKKPRAVQDRRIVRGSAAGGSEVRDPRRTHPARHSRRHRGDQQAQPGIKQIEATAQLIADQNPALAAVPADRPVLGLAVTLGPFHMANAQFDPPPTTRTPVTVADAAEIENLVTITDARPGSCCSTAPPTTCAPPGPSTPPCTATPATGTRSSPKPGTPILGHRPRGTRYSEGGKS